MDPKTIFSEAFPGPAIRMEVFKKMERLCAPSIAYGRASPEGVSLFLLLWNGELDVFVKTTAEVEYEIRKQKQPSVVRNDDSGASG
jgi:hypothetical protein